MSNTFDVGNYNSTQQEQLLQELFHRVEETKLEWERTADALKDMIILTDSEGRVKRVNRAVRDFTGKTYSEILGTEWEDILIENDMEAKDLYAGSTELLHRPTGRWFELKAHHFEDPDAGYSGNVLTIRDVSQIRDITQALEKTNRKLERKQKKLSKAVDRICSAMDKVIRDHDASIRISNPRMKKCYEVLGCSSQDCPCYGREAMRCWQTKGTLCSDTLQGDIPEKYKECLACPVYTKASSDPLHDIGERFNTLMELLEFRSKE